VLALWAAIPIAILPATSSEVPAEAVRQAEVALRSAMPKPFEPAGLDLAVLATHLAAAGPACRADLECICTVGPFERGTRMLDLDVQKLSARAWSADLRLLAPCEGELIDRKAAVVEASAAGLARFAADGAVALLRGRDLLPKAMPARWPDAPKPAASSGTQGRRSGSTALTLRYLRPTPPPIYAGRPSFGSGLWKSRSETDPGR